jgi:hypothetical protein
MQAIGTIIAVHESESATTRKSPYVRLRSAIRHITDIARGYAGRSASSFLTNTHTAYSAPRFALQGTPFHGCTVAPDAALTAFAVVFD